MYPVTAVRCDEVAIAVGDGGVGQIVKRPYRQLILGVEVYPGPEVVQMPQYLQEVLTHLLQIHRHLRRTGCLGWWVGQRNVDAHLA